MMQFYTGGLDNKAPPIPALAIDTICALIKHHYYEKAIQNAL
jgi:hypothetical protein